nr:MarR family transcriptional regulator [uncultured Cohaesibacter sp.]
MNVEERSDHVSANWPEAVTPYLQSAALLQRLFSLLQDDIKVLLRQSGLTYAEFDALAALRSQPPGAALTPTELYGAMLISSGGLTKVLKSLESQKLVARPTSEGDARKKPILLTDKGREMLAVLMPKIATRSEKLLQNGFENAEDCQRFAERLKGIVGVVEQEIAGGSN